MNPALDQFTELAHELRQSAEEQARRHGQALARVDAPTIAA
ncbi:MAG TPA: hypothetical protein VE441_16750 [Mycobacterium sp.]|nr:hypothetical protein [Mycobacterium sp.]